MKRLSVIFCFFISLLLLSPFVKAHEEEHLRYGDWNIMHNSDNSCAAYTKPYRSTGSVFEKNEPFIVIKNVDKNENTIGVHPGYNIEGKKGFTITVNRRSHLMDIKLSENAWTFSDKQDDLLLNEMLQDGRNVMIRGYDKKGNVSIDYYSLRGLNYIINYFNDHCFQK